MYDFDLIIIGSGPGGYVAAVRAAQLGKKTAIIEAEHLGGICLNWGCIPTKALLRSAEIYRNAKNASKFGIELGEVGFNFEKIIKRSRQVADRLSKGVGFLMKKNSVSVLEGRGRIKDKHRVFVRDSEEKETSYTAENIIIATGARARSFPNMPVDNERVITYKQALAQTDIPESITIIGAGAIGVEFAFFFRTFGAKVTLIEMLPQILPIEDEESSAELTRSLKKMGIKIHTDTKVLDVQRQGDEVRTRFEKNGHEEEILSDKVLVAVGVKPNSENLGLEELGIETDGGWIKTNAMMQTNINSVYAIGDIAGAPWLAHVASAEGILAVEHLSGTSPNTLDYSTIPGCTYTMPQVASIGLTEAKAREEYGDINIGKVPFRAIGKSLALGDQDGFVKIISDAENTKILGAHIVGHEATELLGELGLAKSANLDPETILKTIHAHPTLSEGIMEAAADIFGEAIHI